MLLLQVQLHSGSWGIGDFIKYKERYLRVSAVRDYDASGVRSCTLQMVNLVNYKDFQMYLKYLEGQVIV